MTLGFLVTSLLVVASPGTGALYTVAAGLTRGVRAGLIAAFGCTLGIVPHMLAAATGLAAVFHTSALAFEILRYFGVAYLLAMAWRTLNEHGALKVEGDVARDSPVRVIGSAVMVNLLNPKLSIFFFAFLPQFVSESDPSPILRMLTLSGVFMLMTFAIFALYGAFAAFMRAHVLSRPTVLTWMRRSFAAGFVALGMRLALSAR
jgi:threonine/homoserine/homoserine lactone efflux protein